MNLVKKMRINLLICILAFYILPIASRYWGDDIILVLLALPCICLVNSAIYGVKNGFSLLFPLLVGIIFLSTLFIFYNYTAWIYIIAYIVISLIGCGLGSLFYKRTN